MKLDKLKRFAQMQGFKVYMLDLGTKKECGYLLNNHIFINNCASEDRILYTLAHELAHGYLHKDKGNTVDSPKHAEYEEEADRAAHMILDLLSVDINTCVGDAN
ncbi:ImmA/IrrE family metallo-endopeptidase [Clostridium butyricum]|uniref:ImmA/IrrE family metallo-endopeptidase n=1 Tax=Clostridium TaxID=1485 RepID=UPI00291504D3|nr:ImmA/IrrE family metallo-endopeptidase [Clostridium sp.]MDU5177117.1 ImmA/IrrE family metallo-endopeptidase [Clostridium sp.]